MGPPASGSNNGITKAGRAIDVYLVLYHVPVSLKTSPGEGTTSLRFTSLREPKSIRVRSLSGITQLVHDKNGCLNQVLLKER